MSGAQIVFGIARRVPSPNTPKQSLDATNVSCSAKQIPHTTLERIIFHESNPLTTFCSVTSRHHPVIISNHFLACRFKTRSHWHVLSKQRSCPLIAGFSSTLAWITQPFCWHDSLGIGMFSGLGGAFDIHRLYKGAMTRLFSFTPTLPSTSPTSGSNTQGSS